MKKIILLSLAVILSVWISPAQQKENSPPDSLGLQELQEIILISNPSGSRMSGDKALGSIDSYLEESGSVNMIRRGAYAWEPMLNGMAAERSVITIDGMRIYPACTDKMDPITSYVETTNLSNARISEGQFGSTYGGTIAGSIDLERRKTGFSDQKYLGGAVFTGFEANNKQQIYGAALNYSGSKLYTDLDFTFRDAENYHAGKKSGQKNEVDYSQFTKYNFSFITGVKLTENRELEASLIYDKATDVGYPGLPMDVSLAEALLGSLQYKQENISEHLRSWESKVYFNTVTHIMDDSPRPVVPIRMDMPGWSKTFGFYSKIAGKYKNHQLKATLSGHHNNSLAEMTMYPNNPNEPDMFMLTWPDVNTLYTGLELEDNIYFNHHLSLKIAGGIGVHHNKIDSEFGLNSLRVFYPNLEAGKTRILKNLTSQASLHTGDFNHKLGLGYGERAPGVSEAYGFYLFNINDNYDYVGNPYLSNEKALDLSWNTAYHHTYFKVNAKLHYFYIMDYIVGKPQEGIPPMNMTASGIKVYESLNHASLFNAGLDAQYFIDPYWTLYADASYRYGQGEKNTRLPQIQPLNFRGKISYEKNDFYGEISMETSTRNRNSLEFGESKKHGYMVTNLAFSKNFNWNQNNLMVKLGAENIFDRYYSTFDNWFGIPRMGRNIYANVIFKI